MKRTDDTNIFLEKNADVSDLDLNEASSNNSVLVFELRKSYNKYVSVYFIFSKLNHLREVEILQFIRLQILLLSSNI
jgi:hypothetical protein